MHRTHRLGLRLAASLVLAAPLLVAPSAATATAVREAPWHTEAAAYRLTLFLGNLRPVPWDQIAKAWEAPLQGAATERPAAATIAPESVAEIRSAVADEDRQALFAAATRAIARALTDRLDRAENALASGDAAPMVAEAREIWRALEPGVAAADPAAARRLGLAWLDLASASGSRGVLGAGATPADPDRFAAAKAEISRYVAAEFAPDAFTRRESLQPIPESVAASGAAVDMPPWLPPGSRILDQAPLPGLVLAFEQQGIDEADLPLVAYGDMLFDSSQIFGEPARSLGIACSTCHNRSEANRDFFIPGTAHRPGQVDVDGAFFNPLFNDMRDDPVDIPSLRGLRFTGPYGRDGRFGSLHDFTRNVIVNEFGGPEPTPFMLDALVAYMFEFDFLPNSKIGADGRLVEGASEAAKRGEDLFRKEFAAMDGKSCASCHTPSAMFLDRRAHNVGSGGDSYSGSVSGGFDTPTLLGLRFTAPYLHDGSLAAMTDVMDWKDETYGLDLGEAEKADLLAYLEIVGDADEPYETFDERNTPFRLAFEELTTFASTLDTLLPKRDARHALLLIDTVAADLAADAPGMANLKGKREVYALAETLARVGEAVRSDDWDAAETEWSAFKSLQSEIDERMF